MLVVTIQLCPLGDRENPQTLGVMEIVNDGTGEWEKGNYDVRLWGEAMTVKPKLTGRVEDFPRRKSGVWSLLLACLNSLTPPRKV